jgi:hypothetical protein
MMMRAPLNVQAKLGKGTASTKKLGGTSSRKGGVGYRCVASRFRRSRQATPALCSICSRGQPGSPLSARDMFVALFMQLPEACGPQDPYGPHGAAHGPGPFTIS